MTNICVYDWRESSIDRKRWQSSALVIGRGMNEGVRKRSSERVREGERELGEIKTKTVWSGKRKKKVFYEVSS